MENWLKFTSLEVKIMYMLSLFSLVLYFYLKYKKKKYIVSIFNYGLIFYFFSIYISIFFQYDNRAWWALGNRNSKKFIDSLNESSLVNLLGFFMFFIYMMIFELKSKKNITIKNIKKSKLINSINYKAIKLINYIFLLLAIYLFIFVFKQIPIFGNRLIAQKLGYQTIYNIVNRALFCLTTIIIFRKRKDKILIITNLILMIFSGNRGPVITTVAYLFITKIYEMKINNFQKQKKFIQMLVFLLIIGLSLEFIRGFGHDYELINKIKYGNTFSDIRDGAFILYNIKKKIGDFLWGKTYFADILTFIPAKYSSYRSMWGYSLFTTSTLLGWKNHFGLRGGLFLAPYFNFGYLGVIFFSMTYAYLLTVCEKFFYETIIKRKNKNSYKYILIIINIQNLSEALMIPAGFITFYVVLVISTMIIVAANIINHFIKER